MAAIPDFLSHLNDNNLGLKFTADVNSEYINFLDLCLKGNMSDNSINTVTYRKEVAGNTILLAIAYW